MNSAFAAFLGGCCGGALGVGLLVAASWLSDTIDRRKRKRRAF